MLLREWRGWAQPEPATSAFTDEVRRSNHEEHEGHEVSNVQKEFFVSFVTFVV
jgi:hypothetical protein